jgi:hypothetical protein
VARPPKPKPPRPGEYPELPFDSDFSRPAEPCAPPSRERPPCEATPKPQPAKAGTAPATQRSSEETPPSTPERPTSEPASSLSTQTPQRPPLWKRALEATANGAWVVAAAVLGFILWLLWQAWAATLSSLAWLWAEMCKALVAMLAKWLVSGVLGLVLLLAALVGVHVVPSSYWPWWFRKYWILERLKPPPDLEPWRNRTEDADRRAVHGRPAERPSSAARALLPVPPPSPPQP